MIQTPYRGNETAWSITIERKISQEKKKTISQVNVGYVMMFLVKEYVYEV